MHCINDNAQQSKQQTTITMVGITKWVMQETTNNIGHNEHWTMTKHNILQ